jgi:hypothetical protein
MLNIIQRVSFYFHLYKETTSFVQAPYTNFGMQKFVDRAFCFQIHIFCGIQSDVEFCVEALKHTLG